MFLTILLSWIWLYSFGKLHRRYGEEDLCRHCCWKSLPVRHCIRTWFALFALLQGESTLRDSHRRAQSSANCLKTQDQRNCAERSTSTQSSLLTRLHRHSVSCQKLNRLVSRLTPAARLVYVWSCRWPVTLTEINQSSSSALASLKRFALESLLASFCGAWRHWSSVLDTSI